MKEDKKPDQVVFNSETQRYDAALKPYSTSVGAPIITITDTVAWKNRSISKNKSQSSSSVPRAKSGV